MSVKAIRLTEAQLQAYMARVQPPAQTTNERLTKADLVVRHKGDMRKRKGPNKTEAAFGQWLADEYGPVGLEFEAITLRMPGGTRFTPDWSLRGAGRLMLWEVKGHMREAARVRLKEFAAHFSSFNFFLVRREGRTGWRITEV